MIDAHHSTLSILRQCELLGISRSTYYYEPAGESPENLALMRLIDGQHLRYPFFGRRQMTDWLRLQGYQVNEKRVRRLMSKIGLEAVFPKRKTTIPSRDHRVYPYLLRGVEVVCPNHVWSADITYIPMSEGYMYLVAVMDWYSRHVLSWELSNTMDSRFCVDALLGALSCSSCQPEIFNTDQGSQFTSHAFTSELELRKVHISMDGKGRALDNVFIERLWRTLKYEEVYLKSYDSVAELRSSLEGYFDFYCNERPHQALAGQTPASVYHAATQAA
jgi:putative transposase